LYQAEKSSLCGVTLRSSRAMNVRLPSRAIAFTDQPLELAQAQGHPLAHRDRS
jgi:hypothetical protein